MNKKELLKAVDELMNNYDAFFIANKYCGNNLEDNTHKEELTILKDYFKDDFVGMKALGWIQNCYDCYYKKDYENDEDSAFAYLKNKLKGDSNE